ncbi:MAG: hypothetical protein HYS55_04255 [Candidatus Omnitrophica bacterium]|nr:hypothetical protein [Candidatus Omnitrophota bacterium]
MRFLKFSIVVLFLLSLSSAGLTVYLSTIRENEKAKRLYLEGVKTDLEKRVEALESEKSDLGQRAADLEMKNKELGREVQESKQNYEHAMQLIRDKDLDLKTIRKEAEEAHRAFENAQQRNEELEKILDELESRMRNVETQNALPSSEAGYVELTMTPVRPTPAAETLPEPVTQQELPRESALEQNAIQKVIPVTEPPKPPKRRRFLGFFRRSKQTEEAKPVESDLPRPEFKEDIKPAIPVVPVEEKAEEEKAPVRTMSTPIVKSAPPIVSKPVFPSPPTPKVAAKVEETSFVKKADQTISQGSVLLVNRKYNFVVINLGSRQGLDMDDMVSIRRDGAEIAKARIEKLYDDYSAAYITEERSNQPLGEGDVVTAI